MTDLDFLDSIAAIAEASPSEAPMIPHQEGKTIGNVVMDAGVVGFSQEAIDLIRASRAIGGDMAIVAAWESARGAAFSWIGSSTMLLPASLLTITSETASFDFSMFQQIPNDVPSYSLLLKLLGLDQHEV